MTFEDNNTQRAELSHLLDVDGRAATPATLASIVARSRRRRERRLKIITGVSIVVALTGASVAGIRSATKSTTSASKIDSTQLGRSATPLASPAWTKQQRTLGTAPKGLKWSAHPTSSASAGASSASPNAATSLPGGDLCTVGGCGVPYPIGIGGSLTRLFVRTSGDVTVRAFDETTTAVVPEPGMSSGSASSTSPPASSTSPSAATGNTGSAPAQSVPIYTSCESTRALVVEVSNPGAVGGVTVPLPSISISEPGQPFEVIDSAAVGVAEASPIEVLTVHVASTVKSVQANFADGTSDQIAAVSGWAVLVDDGNAPVPATIKALDGSGSTIATASVNADDAIAQPEQCLVASQAQPQLGGGTARTTGSK